MVFLSETKQPVLENMVSMGSCCTRLVFEPCCRAGSLTNMLFKASLLSASLGVNCLLEKRLKLVIHDSYPLFMGYLEQ